MKKWLRASIALLALVAMLAENTYSVYAAMEGYTSEESAAEVVEEIPEQTVEVETEAEIVEESADEVEEAVANEDTWDAADEMTEEDTDTGRRSAGVVSASIEAFDDRLTAEGVDDFTLYINTDQMNDSDTFSLAYTEDAVPFMDDVLFGKMTKEDGGIYNISELDQEFFEIWVDTISPGMEVEYEIREDDYPQITLISEPEPEVEKVLEVDGNTVYGQGYTELHISVNTTDLPDDTYYALQIESDAEVKYDGETLPGNVIETLSNRTEDIYLSNLDKQEFVLYVMGESTDEVGAEYFVESVENGALRMSINMDGSGNGEGANKVVDLKATIVDEFGDEIGEEYTDMELPEFDADVLVLDDVENPPVADVEISNGPATLIKYTYVEALIDKKVITALKRKEVTDEETGERGYAYAYTTDGETWKSIREDSVVLFKYSDGKKSVYEYEDAQISVVATLQHANAIPDDAEFIVTPITAESAGYNYDVYMQALNENAEEILGAESDGETPVINENNVLLYDIGFFIVDEDGNRKELQPADGAVKISINFKNNQLEEELGSTEDAEVTVVHMPLSDEVKEETDTTEDATDISAADINVEVVSNTSSEEAVDFTLSDFSATAVVVSGKMVAGPTQTFKDILGSGVIYGVVANDATLFGDLESTIAVTNLHANNGSADVQSPRNGTNSHPGSSLVGSFDGNHLLYSRNGNGGQKSDFVLYTTPDAYRNMGQQNNGTYVDTTTYSYDDIKSTVDSLISNAQAKSTQFANQSAYAYSQVKKSCAYKNNAPEFEMIDIRGFGAGTYYVEFAAGEFARFTRQDNQKNLVIGLNSDQNIILNIPDSEVNFPHYYGFLDNTWFETDAGEPQDNIYQRIIFNCPNATKASTVAPTGGVFLLAKCNDFATKAVSAGWIVTKKITSIGGQEWHNVWHDMPSGKNIRFKIKGTKKVDGKNPGPNQKFWFDLVVYGDDNPDGAANGTVLQSKQNNGQDIVFDEITYTIPGRYSYWVRERQENVGQYTYDPVGYIVKLDVSKDATGKMSVKIYYIARKVAGQKEYDSDYNATDTRMIAFNNPKDTSYPYDFPVKKLFYVKDGTNWNGKDYFSALTTWLNNNHLSYGEGWPDGATFTFRLEKFDGGAANSGSNIQYDTTPLPEATKVAGKDYCEITLTKDQRTGTFGKVNFPLKPYDDGTLTSHYWDGNVEVWNRTYMYKIYEVVPDDAHKVPGVTYSDKVIYLKIFVDCKKNSNGEFLISVHDKISLTNTANSCYDNPGPFEFVNHYRPGSLKVKKIAVDKNGNKIDSDKDFYVVVYREASAGNKVYYGLDGKEYLGKHTEIVKGNSEITYKPLPVGYQYYIYESDANGDEITDSQDYEISYTSKGVQISKNSLDKEVTITNKKIEKGILNLIKKGGLESESPFNLAGVTFYLYNSNDNPVYVSGSNGQYTVADPDTGALPLVTDANGSFKVEGLPLGNYYVKESSLPDNYREGFVPYTEKIEFTVNKNGTKLTSATSDYVKKTENGAELKLTVYNKRVPAKIKVEKAIISAYASGSVQNQDKKGYVFYLYDKSDNNKKVATATTDEEGNAVFDTVLTFGHTYKVEEDADVAAAKGTILNSLVPSEFTVDNSWYENAETTEIGSVKYIVKGSNVINKEIRGKVRLIKTDAEGVKIPEGSAKFVLSTSATLNDETKYVHVSGTPGAYKFDKNTTNTTLETVNGELTVEDLAPGTYYFFEIASPDDNKYTFTSGQAYPFTIDPKKATKEDPIVKLISDEDAVKVQNGSFSAALSFEKVNAYNIRKKLGSGTEFTLYATNGLGGVISGDAIVTVAVNNGTVSVPFAKAGTYVLVETKTQAGYVSQYSGDNLKIYLQVKPEHDKKTDLTLADVAAYATQDGRTLTKDELVDKAANHAKNEPELGKVTLHKRFLDKNGDEISADSKQAYLLGEATFELWTNSDEFKRKNNDTNVIGKPDKYVKYGTYTTTSQTLTVENLPWGTYYFVETVTYKIGDRDVYVFDPNAKYTFVIGENSNEELQLDVATFLNDKGEVVDAVDNRIITGSVEIIKQDQDTKDPIPGINFDLYRVKMNADDTYSVVEQIMPASGSHFVTGADGKITVPNLEFGKYYFVESAEQTVKGYNFDTETKYFFDITEKDRKVTGLSYLVEGVNQTSADGIIDNKPVKGTVTLDKWAIARGTTTDPEYLAKLAGAEFELYSNNTTTFGQSILSVFNGEGKYYLYKADGNGKYITGENGSLTVTNLPWGSYYFVETKAPQGYEMPADPADRTYYFTIDGEHLNANICRPEVDVENDEVRGKVPVNERLNGCLKLIKKDAETNVTMSGVPFRLYKDGADYTAQLSATANRTNKAFYTFANGTSEELLITDANGEIKVEELPWGEYYFKEADVPEGYTIDTTDSAHVTISVANTSAEATYTAENTVTMLNTPIKGDLLLEKVDNNGQALKGATFDLVRVENNEYHKVNVTTTATGKYVYASVDSSDYRGSSIGQTIKEFLSTIFGGSRKGDLETDDNAQLTVDELPYGNYEIYEITPPDGFEPNKESPQIIRSFKIDGTKDNNHDAIVEFVNSKIYAGVQFVKTMENEELEGAIFVLEKFENPDWKEVSRTTSASGTYYKVDDPNNEEVGTFKSVVTFSGLPVGDYRIYEVSKSVKPTNGADPINTYPYLNVNDKEIWSVADENTKFYTFKITMSDSGKNNVGLDNKDGVYQNTIAETVINKPKQGNAKLLKMEGTTAINGAKFALFNGEKNNRGEYVLGTPTQDTRIGEELTSVNGEVLTPDLNWGTYYLVETQTSDSRYFLEENIDDRAQFHFTIAPDANGNFTKTVTTFTAMQKGKQSKEITVVENEKIYGKAEFTKRNADTLGLILSDQIKFDLYYRANANEQYKQVARYSGANALNAANGYIRTAKDLEVGSYYFIETSTAPGFEPLPAEDQRPKYYFEIRQKANAKADDEDKYEITWSGVPGTEDGIPYVLNTPLPGSIKLFKCFVLDGEQKPLSGATFKLVGTTEANVKVEKTGTSNAAGEVLFDNLKWGTYSITEVTPPAGYKLPDGYQAPQDIVINAAKLDHSFGEDESLKIVNERKPGSLKLKKVDGKGRAIAGVAFELQKKVGDDWVQVKNPENEKGYYVTGEGGLLSIFKIVDPKGTISIEGLEWGTYRIYEREVPEGLMLLTDPIKDANGNSEFYIGAGNTEKPKTLEYDLGTVVNNDVHGNIGLRKVDAKDNTKGLDGAEFVLFQADGENHHAKAVYVKKTAEGVYAYVSLDATEAAKTADSTLTLVSPTAADGVVAGKIKVTGLPCGTYYMQETKAPNPGTDASGNTVIYKVVSGDIGPFSVTVDQTAEDPEQAVNSLTWENPSDDFYANVLFYKTNARYDGLDGVVYEVIKSGTDVKRYFTSQQEGTDHGVVRIPFYSTGEYTIQEYSTPNDAYELDPNVYTIQITAADNGRTIDLSELITTLPSGSYFQRDNNRFVNPDKPGSVKLLKVETESDGEGAPVIGGMNDVTFTLEKNVNGNWVPVTNGSQDSFVTATVGAETGVIIVDNLEWGSYRFVEVVPEDYEAVPEDENTAAEIHTFEINAATFAKDQKIEVVRATNRRKPGSLTVQKFFEDPEDGFNGEGVNFKLELVAGTSDVVTSYERTQATWKDENGNYFVSFTGLPWGIYTLTEVDTKEGYIKCTGTRTVKIGNAKASAGKTFDVEGLNVSLLGEQDPDAEVEDVTKGILNKKIKGSIKLQKVDSVKEAPVVASFKLYKGAAPETIGTTTTGKNPVVMLPTTDAYGVFTTDTNGYFEFPAKSLAYGKYYLEEQVPEGYEGYADGAFTYRGVNFEIKTDETLQLTKESGKPIVNTPDTGKIKLRKVDDKDMPIKGVIFTLYADDAQGTGALDLLRTLFKNMLTEDAQQGVIYATLQTDAQGKVEVSGLPWGTYHIVETLPTGYTMTAEKQADLQKPFYLGVKNNSKTLEYDLGDVVNTPEPGTLTLTKKGVDELKPGQQDPLAGALFDLYLVNGVQDETPGTEVGDDKADTRIRTNLESSADTENLGKVVVKDLPWGTYYFVETKAPDGFEKSTAKPDPLTIGRQSKDGYTDVTVEPTPGFLHPETTVLNVKGYGYTALYKVFDKMGRDEDNTGLDLSVEKDGTSLTFEIYAVDANGNAVGNPIEASYGATKGTEFPVHADTLMTDLIGPLPYGKYVFVEKSVPKGVDYQVDQTPKPFEVDETSTRDNVLHEMNTKPEERAYHFVTKFVNTTYRGWANIAKTDLTTGDFVAGVDFKVYEATENAGVVTLGAYYGTYTTETDGVATVIGMPLGKYAFVEDAESAKALGYIASDSAYVFDVTEATVANNNRPEVREATKNADNTYTLATDKAPVGYVENDRFKGSIHLTKTGKNSKPLAGATFNLWKVVGIRDVVPGVAAGGDQADEIITVEGSTDLVTDANGEITVTDLAWGTYYFDEIIPPQGYTLLERPNHDAKTISGDNVNATAEVTMEDTPIRLDILKTDITGSKELEGAQMAIYPADDDTTPLISWTSTKTAKRIEIGDEFGGLTATTDSDAPVVYLLRETMAPEGYTVTTDIYFSVDTAGKVTLYNKSDDGKYTAATLENAEVVMVTDNGGTRTTPLVKVKDNTTSVKITKRELGTTRYLPGATLAIYDEENFEKYKANPVDAVAVDTWTTAATDAGEAHVITGKLQASNGTKHLYYLVETKVPAGFYQAAPIAFTVDNNNEITLQGSTGDASGEVTLDKKMLIMYDRPVFVEIIKKETTKKEVLPGAELKVSDADKKVNVTFTTTKKPALLVPVTAQEATSAAAKAKYDALAETYQLVYDVKLNTTDTYTLSELSAPKGYKLAAAQTFKVDPADKAYSQTLGIYTTEMLDPPIKLFVSKKDLTGEKELAGATMSIYEKNGEYLGAKVVSWISSTKEHLVSINDRNNDEGILERGKEYWLVEDAAPLGYALTAKIGFAINADGSVAVDDYVEQDGEKIARITLKDEPLALCVSKENAKSMKLAGAKLELRTTAGASGDVIATWESDGKIAFISEHATYTSPNYTQIKLNDGMHLRAGVDYYVVETEAPKGYEKAEQPIKVQALPLSDALKDVNLIHVKDPEVGKVNKGGTKTWNLLPDMLRQLLAQNKKIKINLYRYYVDDAGKNVYVDKNKTVTDKEHALLDTRTLSPSLQPQTYLFDDLDQYYYSEGNHGKAYDYHYEIEEDLSEVADAIVSKKVGDNLINNQRYTHIEGDKKWILFKDGDKILDVDSDENLREMLEYRYGKNVETAYVNVDIALATESNGTATIVDKNADGKPDYYVTIRHGAANTKDDKLVEKHDTILEGESEHIEIVWTQPGQVHFGFKNLPAFDENNNEIKYCFVEQASAPADNSKFEVTYADGKAYGTNGTLITNMPLFDPFTIRGQKLWKDPFDKSLEKRPEVTIQLYKDGVAMPGYRKVLKAEENYRFEFAGLYEFDFVETKDGHRYNYELKEEGASGDYEIEVDFNGSKFVIASDGKLVKEATITNKIKPEYITISGTKKWRNLDPSNVPEVTFYLYKLTKDASGKEVKEELNSYTMKNAANNKYEFTRDYKNQKLPKYDENGKLITYKVEEDLSNLGGYKSTPVGGYTITPSEIRGQILYTGNDFENTPTTLRIRKTDMTTRKILPGAVMRVVDSKGKVIDRWTTSYEDHYVEGLIYGETYTMEEISAPEGYMLISPIKFTVDDSFYNVEDNNDPMIVEDPPIKGRVVLTKRDAETRETLSGAVFNLYTSDDKLVRVTGSTGDYTYSEDGGAATSLTVNSAGTLAVNDLPYGTYYFREITAPLGHVLSTATERFTIYENEETVEVTFLNERAKGAVYLRKAGEDGTALAGAVFELYAATPRTPGQAAASTIYSDAYYRYGSYVTGADGMIYVRDLPWDDYYFIEVAAPDGYITNTDVSGDPLVYTFRIDSTSASSVSVSLGTITNRRGGGGGGGGEASTTTGGGGGTGSGVAGVRQKRQVSDVLGVRAKPSSGVLGARVGPVTGDAANIVLWLLLLVASVSVIVVICIQNHKRKKRNA